MFSASGIRLGAGERVQLTPFRSPSGRIINDDGTSGPAATPAMIATLAALVPGSMVGPGGPVPLAFMGAAPAIETRGRFLGSTATYDQENDIGGKMSITSLAKSFRSHSYFGVARDGVSIDCRSNKDLTDWLEMIVARVRPDLPTNMYGGNLVDYLCDHTFDPVVVPGVWYFPGVGDTWRSFTANAAAVDHLEERKSIIRQHVADICMTFSEPSYWRELCRTVSGTNGQEIIGVWRKNFLEDDSVNVNARAEALRTSKYVVHGATNPAVLLQSVLTSYNGICSTEYKDRYQISWFATTVMKMFESNVNYSIFRQSGGDQKVMGATTTSAIINLFVSCWSNNHAEWEKMEKNQARFASRAGEMRNRSGGVPVPERREGGGGDQGSLNEYPNVKCFNCNKKGHYASACDKPARERDVAGPSRKSSAPKWDNPKKKKKAKVGRSASWEKAPCLFKQCPGPRDSHAGVDCPAKLANDARSARGDVEHAKAFASNGGSGRVVKVKKKKLIDVTTNDSGVIRRVGKRFPPPSSSSESEDE